MPASVRTVFGPPGTGKTTTLLDEIDDLMQDGQDPSRIAFVSFTRQAAREASTRALNRFSNLCEDDLPYWSTLHSNAFKNLGASRDQMLTGKELSKFGEVTGLEFSEPDDMGRIWPNAAKPGDEYMRLYGLSVARGISLKDQWCECSGDLPFWALENFAKSLESYKKKKGLLTFDDLLIRDNKKVEADHVFVDEAQDLTPLQIQYLRKIVPENAKLTFAGDDDQAVFEWAGADAGFLQRLKCDRDFLAKSWRLPKSVKGMADDVIKRCAERVLKSWESRDEDGVIDWVGGIQEVDLLKDGTWLLMARHRAQLTGLVAECRRQGVVYHAGGSWSNEDDDVRAVLAYEHIRKHGSVAARDARKIAGAVVDMPAVTKVEGEVVWADMQWPAHITPQTDWMGALNRLTNRSVEYIRELRRNDEPLKGAGRIRISTVHSAKGGEADNVFLMTDINRRTDKEARNNPDAETRVMYVGMTRARNRLLLCRPQTGVHWKI